MIDLSNLKGYKPKYSSDDYAKMIEELNLTEAENRLMNEILNKETSYEELENSEKYYLYLDIRAFFEEKKIKNKVKLRFENYHRFNNLEEDDEEERIMKNISNGNGELHGF